MKQFRRAVSIENILKAGVFDYQFSSRGYEPIANEPPRRFVVLCGAAVNYIFCAEISAETDAALKGEGIGFDEVLAAAQDILSSDVDLERVVVRTLYDLASLSMVIEMDDWSEDVLVRHPRLMEVVISYRGKYPELFSDVAEKEFESLFEKFVKKYYPSMKGAASSLF